MFQLLGVGPVGMAKTRFGKRKREKKREKEKEKEKRKEEKKKIKRAPSITWSFPLPFPSYGNLYPRCLFRRSFFVSIVSSVIRFWEISDGERLYTLSYNSAPNMKNARHFQPCPNLCISSFQFSVMERMAEQWRFCHPSFISIKKAV